METIMNVWPFVLDHAYVFLFLGMLIGGETFLLPAVYLAGQGMLSFPLVVLFAALATIISDSAWYAVGRFSPLPKLLAWKKLGISTKILEIFKGHGQKLLFLSKFVYGTRTMAQILSGVSRMSFLTYSLVNLFGILSYFLVLVSISVLTHKSLVSLEDMTYNNYISVTVFALIIIIIHIWLKKWLGRKFAASSFPR